MALLRIIYGGITLSASNRVLISAKTVVQTQLIAANRSDKSIKKATLSCYEPQKLDKLLEVHFID